MSKSTYKAVRVQIIGGLGNQLFGYAAGYFLSEKTSTQLILDLSLVGKGGTDHGKSLLDFKLEKNPKIVLNRKNRVLLNRVNNKLMRTFPVYKSINSRLRNVYVSRELGYEETFFALDSPKLLVGYFQTYEYANLIKDDLRRSLDLKSPSVWYLDMKSRIEIEKPIVVHIRRGDYLNLVDEFGILSINYYRNALERFNLSGKERIWIFSDSPELIKKEVSNLTSNSVEVIVSPPESSPAESLLLMSKAHSIVISNSTFSWWAAFMSSIGTQVVAPEKWFRGRSDPSRLIPPNWITVPSLWDDLAKSAEPTIGN